MGVARSTHGRGGKCVLSFGRKTCREGPLGRRRRRREDNIRIGLSETVGIGALNASVLG